MDKNKLNYVLKIFNSIEGYNFGLYIFLILTKVNAYIFFRKLA